MTNTIKYVESTLSVVTFILRLTAALKKIFFFHISEAGKEKNKFLVSWGQSKETGNSMSQSSPHAPVRLLCSLLD